MTSQTPTGPASRNPRHMNPEFDCYVNIDTLSSNPFKIKKKKKSNAKKFKTSRFRTHLPLLSSPDYHRDPEFSQENCATITTSNQLL
jgi:hypothetical protein